MDDEQLTAILLELKGDVGEIKGSVNEIRTNCPACKGNFPLSKRWLVGIVVIGAVVGGIVGNVPFISALVAKAVGG